MADSRKIVKVFIASPGDLNDERKAAKGVIDEFNALLAEEFGYQVELVGWEDTVSVFGRPQEAINRELARCELFVGMMWKHWGTPPDVSGQYSSGFEEEYLITVNRRLQEGQPEISLFFKEIDPEFLKDPGEGLKRVLDFKERLISEKKILFENFLDIQEFEKKFRRCITTYIRSLRMQETATASRQNQSPIGDNDAVANPDSNLAIDTPFSGIGTKFLRNFITKTELDAGERVITAVEVARVRLLANIVGIHGNDESTLGVHDSNLLFSEGKDFDFGRDELVGLFSCGLERFPEENVPLWHWYEELNGPKNNSLSLYSFAGNSKTVVGALTAMKVISEPLHTTEIITRNIFLDSWFSNNASSSIRVAALAYLGQCGITSDLDVIRAEINKADYETTSAAIDAYLRISLRDSREAAVSALYELQPTSLGTETLEALFKDNSALSTSILLGGISHSSTAVRNLIVKILRYRKCLPTNIAESLLNDNEASIRYEALMSLKESGHIFTATKAEQILIKRTHGSGLGIFGRDSSGESNWHDYWRGHLKSLNDSDILEIEKNESIFEKEAEFVLAERNFLNYAENLRESVDDQYKSRFNELILLMAERFSGATELIEKTRSLEESIRKSMTRKGLDLICAQFRKEDLNRVRNALKSGFLDFSEGDIKYLQKFGEWQDIQLIIDSTKRSSIGLSIIPYKSESRYRLAAKAIYKLSHQRLPEVLTIPMPPQLLAHFLAEVPDGIFITLNNSVLIAQLKSEDSSLRKLVSLKCVKALTKTRMKSILNEYLSFADRYYNVLHWLDFGISTSKSCSSSTAQRIISKEWLNK